MKHENMKMTSFIFFSMIRIAMYVTNRKFNNLIIHFCEVYNNLPGRERKQSLIRAALSVINFVMRIIIRLNTENFIYPLRTYT